MLRLCFVMLRKKFTILSRIKGDVMTIIGKFDFHIQQTTIDVKMNRILNIRIFEFRENFLLNFDIFKKFSLYFFALFVVKTVGYRGSFYGMITLLCSKICFYYESSSFTIDQMLWRPGPLIPSRILIPFWALW